MILYCDVFATQGYGTPNEKYIGLVESDYIGKDKKIYTLSTEGTMQDADGRQRFNAGNINIWYNGFKFPPEAASIKFAKKWFDEDGTQIAAPDGTNALTFEIKDLTTVNPRPTLTAKVGSQIEIKPGSRSISEKIPAALNDYHYKSVTLTENDNSGNVIKTLTITPDTAGVFNYAFEKNKKYTVTYSNQYVDPDPYKNITIEKEQTKGKSNIKADEVFSFLIGFDRALPDGYDLPDGVKKVSAGSSGIPRAVEVYEFGLQVNDSITFADVPKKTSYVIKEVLDDQYKCPTILKDEVKVTAADPGIVSGVVKNDDAVYTFVNDKWAPAIQITKNVLGDKKDYYMAGDAVVYQVVITNTGDVGLTNVIPKDEKAAGPYATAADASAGTNLITAPEYTLGVGNALTLYYVYKVPADSKTLDVFNNTATVTGKGGGQIVGGSDDEGINIKNPHLSIIKEVCIGEDEWTTEGAIFESGSTASFRVTVTNSGYAPAEGVKLADTFTGGNVTLSYCSLQGADMNSFTVPARSGDGDSEVIFIFTADMKGMTEAEVRNAYSQELTARETALNKVIGDLEASLTDADDYNGQIEYWNGLITGWEDQIEALDPDENAGEILELEGQIEAAKEAIKGLTTLYNTMLEAQKDYDELLDKGITGLGAEFYYNYETNTANFKYNGKTTSSDPVELIIKPESVTNISLTKQVSLSGGDGSWEDAVEISKDGQKAFYLVTINNKGSVDITFDFSDDKLSDADIEKSYTIKAGETLEIRYSIDWPANEKFKQRQIVNTATIEYGEGETKNQLTDTAVVNQPAQTYAKLHIDKKVLTPIGFSGYYSVISDNPVDFIYRVIICNSGTETALFTLTDDILGEGDMFYDFDADTKALTNKVTGSSFTLEPNASVTFYYDLTLSSTTKNTATYMLDDSNNVKREKDREGSDSARVKITSLPEIQLGIIKKVTTKAEYENSLAEEGIDANWRDAAQISNDAGEGDFVFQITVTKTGNYPVWVDLTDSMPGFTFPEEEMAKLKNIAIDAESTSAAIVLFANGVTTGTYNNTVTLSSENVDVGDANVKVTYVDGVTEEDVTTVSDSATITVGKDTKPVINIDIEKKVWDGSNWVDSISVRARNATVKFRVTVTADPGTYLGDYKISGTISDTYAKDAKDSNGDPVDWSYVLEKNGEVNNNTKVFEYEVTFDGVGKYNNVAVINDETEHDEDIDVEIPVKEDDATTDLSTGGNPPNRPPGNPPTNIPDAVVPLTDTPALKPDVVITDPDVPLADVPQTGTGDDIAFNLMMLGLSLSALLALMFGRKRNEARK